MQLSNTQLMVLSAASQREDQAVVLPPSLKGNAAKKVVEKLINETLVQEFAAKDGMPVWRHGDNNRAYSLRITKLGLEAIAVNDGATPVKKAGAATSALTKQIDVAPRSSVRKSQPSPGKSAVTKRRKVAAMATARKTSSGKDASPSKQDAILSLLRRPEGASLDALVKTTGWQKHSVRGFLAGTVRKKLKLPLVSEKVDAVRTYRIGKPKAAKGLKAASSRAA